MNQYTVTKIDAGLAIVRELPERGFRSGVVSSLEIEAADYRLDAAHYFAAGLVKPLSQPDEDEEFPTERMSWLEPEASR